MNWGEIWWFEHPDSKRRPVCILTRAEAVPSLPHLLVAEATTTRRGLRTEVELDAADGMPQACVVNLDTASSVQKSLLTKRITTLSAAKMNQICDALAFATGCS